MSLRQAWAVSLRTLTPTLSLTLLLIDPHRHRHCSAAYRAVALRKPLAARPAHALVAARDEDVSLGLIEAHNARLAVGVVHRISRRPLLGDLVD